MMMKLVRPAVLAAALSLAAAPAAHAAANKEHQQLMAEIRMLQEQQQQLQAMLGTLGDAMKALSTKLDDQSGAMRKAMADQTLSLNGIGETTRVLREKVDDTNVRVSSVSQEIEALRQAIASSQASAGAPQAAPTGMTDPGLTGSAPSQTPVTVPPSGMGASGQSPQRAYDASMDDYTAGRFDLAIRGFESFIAAFPKHPNASSAQFYIGQAYFGLGNMDKARDAFQQVIASYPQSGTAPDAYFKLGQSYERLNQLDLAKRAYETVVKNYPATTSTVLLAQQALDRLNRK